LFPSGSLLVVGFVALLVSNTIEIEATQMWANFVDRMSADHDARERA
jgi:hypothetical protein